MPALQNQVNSGFKGESVDLLCLFIRRPRKGWLGLAPELQDRERLRIDSSAIEQAGRFWGVAGMTLDHQAC